MPRWNLPPTLLVALLVALFVTLSVAPLVGCEGDDDDDDDDTASADDDDDDDDTADDDDGPSYTVIEDPLPVDLAKDLADTWIGFFEPWQNAWSWDSAVLMVGMLDLAEVTGEEKYTQYCRDWLDYWIEDHRYHIATSDTTVPSFPALRLYELTGDEKYKEPADEAWNYIRNIAVRTSDGGLNHLGWLSGVELWVDSLFMLGPYMLTYADTIGSGLPDAEYAHQLDVFHDHLFNTQAHLFKHKYSDTTGEVLPAQPNYWGRGNGWAFVAQVYASAMLPEATKAGLSYDLDGTLHDMLDTLLPMEDESGRFHTIVNRDDTYLETSTGLLLAYGVGLAIDWGVVFEDTHIDDIERWLQGATDQIVVDAAGDTLLLGTSYGTGPGDVAAYQNVLKGENVSYGLGLYLLAAARRETIGPKSAISAPSGETDETWVDPPVPCEGVECGKFYVARGNFYKAQSEFDDVLEASPNDSEALFFSGLIDVVRVVVNLVFEIDKLTVGDITMDDIVAWLGDDAAGGFEKMTQKMSAANGAEFASYLDRLLLIESGGHTAVGGAEFDNGEALLLGAVGDVVLGVFDIVDLTAVDADAPLPRSTGELKATLDAALEKAEVTGEEKALKSGLQRIAQGLDGVVAALEYIGAETDDQSDDFLPANLFRLEGTFGIPGVLVEGPVIDLFGLTEEEAAAMNWPDDLIKSIKQISTIIKVVAAIF
ncbi:MAG: glycoside hydrolase family 88 protein [Deltaproteobacteria bacterium]|nr:glycoside hydrolase family 88 protein [Deltaproteobacteria bacterium]